MTTVGIEWLYKALEQYTYITIRSIVFKLISIIAMFMLVHSKSDYIIYGAITTFASSGSYILNLINANKFVALKPIGNYNLIRHIKPILIFFTMSIATTVYTNLDSVMLGFMKTDADVGFYTAAVKIKNILVSIVTSLGTVLLPRASYYIEQHELDKFKELSRKAMNFVVVTSLPLLVYFMIFAKNGIYFLSGSSYMGAVKPMQIIMPTLIFIGISNITSLQILVPLGEEKIILISSIIGAIIDLIINILLIPSMASSGAAIGTLCAEFCVTSFQYIFARKYISSLFGDIAWWKILLANIISTLLSFNIGTLKLNNLLILILSAVIYFGTYLIILLLLKEKTVLSILNELISLVKKKRTNN